MFSGCNNLLFLDISSCDSDMTSSISSMFNSITSLEYINIYNTVSSSKLAGAITSAFNSKDNLVACQKNSIITYTNAIYACCYYNDITSECEFQNYITVKYKESVQYINGFQISPRSDILFIEYQNVKYRYNENMDIDANTEIKIYLSTNIASLESFFDSSFDPNTEKIISIDLVNFDSSLITTLDRMFYGCNSIDNINFSNFITSSVNTMIKMFYGCSQLESIDLSSFDTMKLENMQYMFYGCSQLLSINLSNFNSPLLNNVIVCFMDVAN
jgi:surface protein